MKSIDQHPLAKWLGVIIAFSSILATCVGAFLYLEDLRRETSDLHDELIEGFNDKKELDKTWLELDREDHADMIELGNQIRNDIRLLDEKIRTNPILMYQIGLRDGKRLCDVE